MLEADDQACWLATVLQGMHLREFHRSGAEGGAKQPTPLTSKRPGEYIGFLYFTFGTAVALVWIQQIEQESKHLTVGSK